MPHFPASALWKQQSLHWADAHFEYVFFLQNKNIAYPFGGFPTLLAVANPVQNTNDLNAADSYFLSPFSEVPLFGFLGYDLKNQWETTLVSLHQDRIGFPDAFFFIPEHLIYFHENHVEIVSPQAEKIYREISLFRIPPALFFSVRWHFTFTKEEYLQVVRALQVHIEEGDIYEINFCIEQFAENLLLSPVDVFERLQLLSYNPFSAFVKYHDCYALCASPERFLKKMGNQIISQPIKGTSKRSEDSQEDVFLREALFNNPKERSENMMITDLVRNDLACIAEVGTVKVIEMFGVYSFPKVHQLISTIGATLKRGVSFQEILASTFPMGSMTGAPKIKAMELIEHYERSKRGLFSGSIGYILPNGDFDFNVVIRTLFYNKTYRTISIQAGSAVTYESSAEQEYEECLLKLSTISQALK